MPDAVGLVKAMKRAALEAMEASKPVNVYFGRVISASPLQISVEQKMILGEAQLILARTVTEFKTMVTVRWESEKETETEEHTVVQKEITIHNQLKVGDEVILIRQQEGQKYVVMDRIGVM